MLRILLALIFLPLCVQAQQDTLIIVDQAGLDGSFIKPYTNKWKVTYITPEGKKVPNKIWTDYGHIISLNGKQYYHRVQDLYDPQMNLQDTWINMVLHKSLVPVSFSTLNPTGGFAHYNFEHQKIMGSTNLNTKSGEVIEIDTTVNQQLYDCNLYGMMLVGLPLKKGLIAKIPCYNFQKQAIEWIIVNVPEKESLTLPNGNQISTYKAVTNKNLTFWLSKEAPYVIKLELYMANGAMLVWEMI